MPRHRRLVCLLALESHTQSGARGRQKTHTAADTHRGVRSSALPLCASSRGARSLVRARYAAAPHLPCVAAPASAAFASCWRARISSWFFVGSQCGSWKFLLLAMVLFLPLKDCHEVRRPSPCCSIADFFSCRLNILSFFFFFSITSAVSSGRISSDLGTAGLLLSCAASAAFRSAVAPSRSRTRSSSTSAFSPSPRNRTSADPERTSTIVPSYQRPSLAWIAEHSPPAAQADVSGRWYGRTSLKSTCAVLPKPRYVTK
mmetsp:Transcript_3733/g.12560  ORF Transcript_3733/g.12560 Transcript_3733/m.12560 type:complete len:259 (-) Transcript_3733:334-1110(-)